MTLPEYKTYSLRRTLLVTLVTAATVIWSITAYKSYSATRHEVAELFDAELAQNSRLILALVENSLEHGVMLEHWAKSHLIDHYSGKIFGHKYEKKVAFQLWNHPDHLVVRSLSAPSFPLSMVKSGFSQANIDGHLWHVFTLPDQDGRFVIHVGQRDDIRAELTDDISRQLLIQYLLGMPLLAFTIWIIIGRSLNLLNRLAQAVKERKVNHLAPISAPQIPREVEPLVDSINALLARLEQALEKERRFAADASHELRTPLAGLKTQAQVALRTHEEPVRKNALRNILKAVEQMTHMVGQLLLLARIEQEPELIEKERLSLSRQVQNVLSDMRALADAKALSIKCDFNEGDQILANRQLIDILARNLLENAIRYTPQRGTIQVRIYDEDGGSCLEIGDSGPGIPQALRNQVFQRFFRAVETAQQTPGSGLGLSIVERIASVSDAQVALDDSPLGGLQVRVLFTAG